ISMRPNRGFLCPSTPPPSGFCSQAEIADPDQRAPIAYRARAEGLNKTGRRWEQAHPNPQSMCCQSPALTPRVRQHRGESIRCSRILPHQPLWSRGTLRPPCTEEHSRTGGISHRPVLSHARCLVKPVVCLPESPCPEDSTTGHHLVRLEESG